MNRMLPKWHEVKMSGIIIWQPYLHYRIAESSAKPSRLIHLKMQILHNIYFIQRYQLLLHVVVCYNDSQ